MTLLTCLTHGQTETDRQRRTDRQTELERGTGGEREKIDRIEFISVHLGSIMHKAKTLCVTDRLFHVTTM